MKIILLYFLFFIPLATNAQQVDSLHPIKIQQYLWVGVNSSFVSRKDYDNPSSVANTFILCSECFTFYDKVSNQQLLPPGIEVSYGVVNRLGNKISSFFNAGVVYYHTHFTFNDNYNYDIESLLNVPYTNQINKTTIDFNSNSLGLRVTLGAHLNFWHYSYLSIGIEPQLLFGELNKHVLNSSVTHYIADNGSNGDTVHYYNPATTDSTSFPNVSCNILLGYSTTLFRKKQHPLLLELDVTGDLTDMALYNSYIRRFAVELNIGFNL